MSNDIVIEDARSTLSRAQRYVALAAVACAVASILYAPRQSMIALAGVAVGVYVIVLVDRVLLMRSGRAGGGVLEVTDAEARAVDADQLPIYTVLVPAYHEPEVVGELLRAVAALEYPKERLDIKLLLEEDDIETATVARRVADRHVQIIMVPDRAPRTKPKACNVGLALARGEFVTIYDAEDRPEPLQLRRAVVAFDRLARRDPKVVCLQAVLSFYNPTQNILTCWFTTEYAIWFRWLLPGLVSRGAPVPLGGTSNHFRRDALERLGGWDPWNVTEDADLGIRLHRAGMRTALLDSVTLEEANSDFVNWAKQRSRWYKGYAQTCLVHLRSPRKLLGEAGPRGAANLLLFVGGTPALALANSVFWALTVGWFLGVTEIRAAFPPPVYYAGLASAVFGNFTFAYLNLICAQKTELAKVAYSALLMPVYWLLMSVAAWKAVVQLVSAPSFWEKTAHGLGPRPPVPSRRSAEPDLVGMADMADMAVLRAVTDAAPVDAPTARR